MENILTVILFMRNIQLRFIGETLVQPKVKDQLVVRNRNMNEFIHVGLSRSGQVVEYGYVLILSRSKCLNVENVVCYNTFVYKFDLFVKILMKFFLYIIPNHLF